MNGSNRIARAAISRRIALASLAALPLVRPVGAAVSLAALAASPGLKGVTHDDIAFLAELYRAALTSRRTVVNVYSANAPVDPNNNLGVVFRAFERTFPGITVIGTRIGGAELTTRLDAEIASGHRQCDIVAGGDDYISRGLIVPFDPPLARNVPSKWRYPGNYYVCAALKQFGLVYNSRLVQPGEAPHRLSELLTDKWRGRVTVGQPTGAEPVDSVIGTLWQHNAIDRPTLQRLAAFVPRQDRAPMASISSSWVAQGRFAIALWGTSSVGRQLAGRGAPVAIAPFRETLVAPTGHSLLKGGPSPDAAKLLLAWIFSPLGQHLYETAVFEQGTVPGSTTPSGIPPVADASIYDLPVPGRTDRIRKIYHDVSLPIFGPPQ